MPSIDVESLKKLLGPNTIWRQIKAVTTISSTNAVMVSQANETPHGAVLFADHQLCGRGRFDRSWEDHPGDGLATSVLLRPRRAVNDWGWLPLLVGMAVKEGIADLAGENRSQVTLKWPNDVLIDGRKVCGILCKIASDAVIAGWGINVLSWPAGLPEGKATCLAQAGITATTTEVAAKVLTHLGQLYRLWDSGHDLRQAYLADCDTIGRRVRIMTAVEDPQACVEAVALGVNDNGGLIVETAFGNQVYSAGDVVHLR